MRYLILPLLLAACAAYPPAPEPVPSPPAAEPGACGAAERQRLVGAPVTALERELILGPVRIIRPGDVVTMDFRPDRINFEIDALERIARVYCG
ncbi:I78 family peptidase inhibitor [Limimaricola sp. G21655-S1]|uniref:I78 family peptidase inhibitor n=1 Tax=unclassified Limimaricola TaxID=2626459 RepID=UPI0022AEDE77|nr:I78 family peptidase inhibitor [Limimaricola sp. G21655-S1]MCZ4259302.1 I78 family peptidase inhibitor [Limimaricola sp. G21655-S1]